MPASEARHSAGRFRGRPDRSGAFPHRDHVQVSYELLERHPFPEALLHLARGLRQLAAKAGRPEVYHETITAAFLALIAERRCAAATTTGRILRRAIRTCLRKELLEEFYEPDLLQSAVARRDFRPAPDARGA